MAFEQRQREGCEPGANFNQWCVIRLTDRIHNALYDATIVEKVLPKSLASTMAHGSGAIP